MSRRRRIVYPVLTILLLILLAPMFGVIWASGFAARHGCALHEGFANPCVVGGRDYGDTLYGFFVGGWLMLVTLPVGMIVGIALLAMVLRDILRWRRARRG